MLNILVPVDGSGNALLAVRHAAGMARARAETSVHLVNVQPLLNRHISRFLSRKERDGAREAIGRDRLREAEAVLGEAGVAYKSTVLTGDPAATVAGYASANGIDQIVLGTARRSALGRLLSGSFTNGLLQQASVPVEVMSGSRPGALERIGLPAGVGIGLTALVLAVD